MASDKYLKFSIVLISLLFSSVSSSKISRIDDVLQKWETDSLSAKIGNLLRSLPRFDIHFNRVPADWDPTNQTYYESLGIVAFPLVAIGVLGLVIGIFSLLIKCCCMCCCSKEKKFHAASKASVFIARFRFFFLSVILLAAGVACVFANFSIHQAVGRAVNKFYDTEQTMVGYLNDIENILSQLNDTQDMANQLRPFIDSVNSTAELTYEYRDMINEGEDDRMLALYAVSGVATLISLLALLFSCCSRKGVCCLAVLVVFFAPILWILAGAHLFAGIFVADMCPQFESWIVNQDFIGESNQGIVSYYMDCTGENPLANATQTAELELARAKIELAWAEQNHEPTPVIDALEALVQDLTNLNNDLTGLSNCNTTQQAWLEIKKDACDNILDGFTIILFGCILTGFFYPLFTCFGCCVHSRRHTRGVHGDYVALESYTQNVVITTTAPQSNPPTYRSSAPVPPATQIPYATPVPPTTPPPQNFPVFTTSSVNNTEVPPVYQEAITYPTLTIEEEAKLV